MPYAFLRNQFYNVLSLLLLFLSGSVVGVDDHNSVSNGGASSGCKELLESFAYVSANFTYCAIRNARPIMLCEACIIPYLNVRQVYDDITHLEDTGGEMCKDQLFNLDRLQVVDLGFQYVTNLWQRASCDSCFVLDGNDCPTTQLTVTVQQILNASIELTACIQNHKNDTLEPLYDPKVCLECSPAYDTLNNIYNSLKASTGEINYCMDILDLMNTTRINWSSEIGCCIDRKKPEMIFLTASSIIFLLPLMFYVTAYTFNTKKEQPVAQQKRLTENFERLRHDDPLR